MPAFSFAYSIPYLLVFGVLLLFSIFQLSYSLTDRTNSLFVFTSFLILILFFGLRGFLLTDFQIYYPLFEDIELGNYKRYLFEPGFSLYVILIKAICPNYHFFIFISFLIDMIIFNVFLDRYIEPKYKILSLIFYFAFFGLVLEIDLMRNVKSLMLFLLSIKYIEGKRPVCYFVLNLIGITFHWTSVFFLPLYFFLDKKLSIKALLLLMIMGHVIFIFDINIIKPIILFVGRLFGGTIQEKLDFYVDSEMYGQAIVLSFGYIERLISTMMVLVLYNGLTKEKSNIVFINAFLIFVLMTLYFFEVRIVLTRFCALFAFSYCILWSKVLHLMQKALKPVFLFCIFCILMIKIYTQTNTLFMLYDNAIFGNMQSYDDRLKIVHDYTSVIIE